MVKFNEFFFFFNSDQTLVEMPQSKNSNETFLVIFKHSCFSSCIESDSKFLKWKVVSGRDLLKKTRRSLLYSLQAFSGLCRSLCTYRQAMKHETNKKRLFLIASDILHHKDCHLFESKFRIFKEIVNLRIIPHHEEIVNLRPFISLCGNVFNTYACGLDELLRKFMVKGFLFWQPKCFAGGT